jgi:hypothetical protein
LYALLKYIVPSEETSKNEGTKIDIFRTDNSGERWVKKYPGDKYSEFWLSEC